MNFDNEKKQCLAKIDRSKKQSVDRLIKPIVELLNSHKDYYTTSSCSGRIMLIEKPESGKKYDSKWLFVSHEKADAGRIGKCLMGKNVWFKQEGAILHVCCRSTADAEKLLDIVKLEGFKRSGLINFKRRKVMEIMSTEQIETPAVADGKPLFDDSYLKILVSHANRNMETNEARMQSLYKRLLSRL